MIKVRIPEKKRDIKQSIKNLDIANGLGAGLSLINKKMKVVWVNKIQAKWFGPPAVIRGSYCYKIYHDREQVCPDCPTIKSFRSGKTESCIQTKFTKTGKTKYFMVTAAPIRDKRGIITHVLELVQDVSRQRRLEEEKKKTGKKLIEVNKKLSSSISELKEKSRTLKDTRDTVKKLNLTLERKVRQKTKNLEVLYKELISIFEISRVISSTVDLKEVFSLIARMSCDLLNSKASILRLLDEKKEFLVPVGSVGLSSDYLNNTPIKDGEGIPGLILKHKRPILIKDTNTDYRVKYPDYIKKEGINAILGVPVLFDGESLGTLVVYKNSGNKYSVTDEMVLSTFATQAAIAIKNAQLHKYINENYLDTINTLILTVEARDPYTQGHSSRVTRYSIDIARALKMSDSDVDAIRKCGKLHDIGKIAIPDQLLKTPKALNVTERAQIELHPIIGVRIVAPLRFLERGLVIIRSHHERYDGTGYPDGLRGESIPFIARILSVADAFDAMTSNRPYRNKMNIEKAMEELEFHRGTQFDPIIVDTFLSILESRKH
ncbi:MAG: HD domain-containing phosphohydrolase [bacterium]